MYLYYFFDFRCVIVFVFIKERMGEVGRETKGRGGEESDERDMNI